MIKRTGKWLFCLLLCVGALTPVFAGPAHPSGFEDKPFNERTIRLQGREKYALITLAYPTTDVVVDNVVNGIYHTSNPHGHPLSLDFEFQGYFWQGVFGTVSFDVSIETRKPESTPWTDMESLREWIRNRGNERNQKNKDAPDRVRTQLMNPFVTQLNGISCIQENVHRGYDTKAERNYYFPFDEDHAIRIRLRMVDNSDRPGLAESDWRERAEVLGERLLSTVRVLVRPNEVVDLRNQDRG